MNSKAYDGQHLIADLHGCASLDDVARIERALHAAVDASGATLLDMRVHHFGAGQGVTGVALLAESHISVHTWPEHGYAALDFFLCGTRHDLGAALAAVVAALTPDQVETQTIRRGYGALAPGEPLA